MEPAELLVEFETFLRTIHKPFYYEKRRRELQLIALKEMRRRERMEAKGTEFEPLFTPQGHRIGGERRTRRSKLRLRYLDPDAPDRVAKQEAAALLLYLITVRRKRGETGPITADQYVRASIRKQAGDRVLLWLRSPFDENRRVPVPNRSGEAWMFPPNIERQIDDEVLDIIRSRRWRGLPVPEAYGGPEDSSEAP